MPRKLEMTRDQAIDEAVRYVDEAWPRSMRLLLEGHARGRPIDAKCIACADIVAAIRAKFRGLIAEQREAA